LNGHAATPPFKHREGHVGSTGVLAEAIRAGPKSLTTSSPSAVSFSIAMFWLSQILMRVPVHKSRLNLKAIF